LKTESQFYSVQPLKEDGSKDGGLIHVDASSAQQAAESALGLALAAHGKVPRATVWVMNDAFLPTTVTLYLPDKKLPPGHTAS
jgi:hypothetical protein